MPNTEEIVREYVREKVSRDKTAMQALARQFYKASDGTFINLPRVWIASDAGKIVLGQPNEYLQQYMKRVFKEEVDKCHEAARTVETQSTLPTTAQA